MPPLKNLKNDKVVSLQKAIRCSVKPGSIIHFNIGAEANAALREIIRQYRGQRADFTLVSSGVTTPDIINLVGSGLVKKIITTNCSYTYPYPRPIPLIQMLHRDGKLAIETWSVLTLEQRLMAGAQGLGFLPTRSLIGSELAKENAHAYTTIQSPFEKNEIVGILKSLVPDISIIHGYAADPEGNTVLCPPYFSSIWGPRASRGGTIVTVERIVSTDWIRKRAPLVKLPGYLVKYVCQVPFGAHPQGLAVESIGLEGGYSEDYEFISDFVKASQKPDGLSRWIQEWIIDCPREEDYLRKLGTHRISSLQRRRNLQVTEGTEKAVSGPRESGRFNHTEMMIIAAAREIKNIAIMKDYKTILSGIGVPGLAAWLAYHLLCKEGFSADLMTGTGQFGFLPRPGDPFLMSLANVTSCKMLTDSVEIYGTFVAGNNNRCLSVLGTAEIDPYGNINTVKSGGLYLVGVGGACDAVNAREVLVVSKQSSERFVDRVEFIGCPGDKVRTLVTDLAVFEKPEGRSTFLLTKYIPSPKTKSFEELAKEIKQKCRWKIESIENPSAIPYPTNEELDVLRSLDPSALFTGR